MIDTPPAGRTGRTKMVKGLVKEAVHDRLVAYSARHGLSQAAALDRLLGIALGIDVDATPSTRTER